MALRFNAPPGWPVAPGDWRPEPGWAPDPAWPSAPEGWTFWVEETAAPPAGATRPRRGRRAALLTAAGVALFVVGLLVGQGSSGRALDEARTLVAQAADEQDAVEGERAELDAERTALDQHMLHQPRDGRRLHDQQQPGGGDRHAGKSAPPACRRAERIEPTLA